MGEAVIWAEVKRGELLGKIPLNIESSGRGKIEKKKHLPEGITYKQSFFSQTIARHQDIAARVIAEAIGMKQSEVSQFLQKSKEDFRGKESLLFRNFDPELYTIWNFAKSTNEVHHPGNIPPEI